MTLLGGFAARHKVSLRRTLYIAAGSAAVVIGMPQALESLPPPGERQAALEGAMERLQVSSVAYSYLPFVWGSTPRQRANEWDMRYRTQIAAPMRPVVSAAYLVASSAHSEA